MRSSQWILLAASVAIGVVWTFIVQRWLLLVVFPTLILGQGMRLENFIDKSNTPAFTVLWAGCLTALFIWIGVTMVVRPRSSAQVRWQQPQWWLAASGLVIFGCLCMTWFVVLYWQITRISPTSMSGMHYYPVPAQGWILLLSLVVFDVMLLFWLPTLLASPRTYRLVVPGAVTLLGSR